MTTKINSTHILSQFFTNFAVVWVKYRSGLVLAVRSLWLHKLRAVLSVLGIIIGTSAVITLMSFGKGSMESALEDIRQQGTTNVIVKSMKPADEAAGQRGWVAKYGLTKDDFDRFKSLEAVIGMVPMRIFPQEVRYGAQVYPNARLVATTDDFARINNFDLALGRFLVDGDQPSDEGDDQKFRMVVVLGEEVAEKLFPMKSIIGKNIVLNKEEYTVVGVIEKPNPKKPNTKARQDFSKDIFIPIRTCLVRYGPRVIIRQGGSRTAEEVQMHQITLTVTDIDKVRTTGEDVRNLLERNHPKKDWEVIVPLDRLEEAERARDRYNMLLGIIASISLLVGGIGIMNIMLATVTERTREIGIRRALGAKRRDITLQFIIEAVVQTSIGGVLGTLLGLLIVWGVPPLYTLFTNATLPAKLDVGSIFLSLGVALAVGVLFGWYPARRASRLDPIEALRHN